MSPDLAMQPSSNETTSPKRRLSHNSKKQNDTSTDLKKSKTKKRKASSDAFSSTSMSISRSISSCLRCRTKKIKCSPTFPQCSNCDKAGVECVGVDPSTGREVPRSYIYHLELKVQALEEKLRQQGVEVDSEFSTDIPMPGSSSCIDQKHPVHPSSSSQVKLEPDQANDVSTPNPSDNNNGISFSKLMFTALKIQNHRARSSPAVPSSEVDPSVITSNIDDTIPPAILPPKATAQEFLKIYFAQSNAQLPIIHREEFLSKVFKPIYGDLDPDVSLASNFTTINHQSSHSPTKEQPWFYQYKQILQHRLASHKSFQHPTYNSNEQQILDTMNISNSIVPPAKFHKPLYFLNIIFAISSSVHHLQYLNTISDSFRLAAQKYIDAVNTSSDQLETLQGILLLALYSTMRPANPGVWYVLGTALRICVDLGLHNESLIGGVTSGGSGGGGGGTNLKKDNHELDFFTRDKRRRLFWCAYSIDRQICLYLCRPVGIPEESINTPFPSVLDDSLIIPGHEEKVLDGQKNQSSYKSIAISFFEIRQIQCEVQRILYDNCELPRKFHTYSEWKAHIYHRLNKWSRGYPQTQQQMNCDFNLEFFNLNYNHTVIRLFGLSPKSYRLSLQEFTIVGEAAKNLIICYYSLYQSKSVNYTWAAVHNLFMAGTSYLFVIYNCEQVRLTNSLSEVKAITQQCITVFNSLLDRCEAARNCRDTFEVCAMVVLKLKYNEVVHGLNVNVDSIKARQNRQHKYVNINLLKLLENLNDYYSSPTDQATESGRAKDQTPFSSEPVRNDSKGVEVRDTHNDLTHDDFMLSVPTTFEWVSHPSAQNNGKSKSGHLDPDSAYRDPVEAVSAPMLQSTNDDLDLFFNELNNLSPISTKSRKNSFSGISSHQTQNQHSSAHPSQRVPIRQIPLSNDSTNSSPTVLYSSASYDTINQGAYMSPSQPTHGNPNKEGKRVYEIIHSMPNEAIWDQFFTTSNINALGGSGAASGAVAAPTLDPVRVFSDEDFGFDGEDNSYDQLN